MDNVNNKILKDLNCVGDILNYATKHKLEPETVLWANRYLKNYPEATEEEALEIGLKEYDL